LEVSNALADGSLVSQGHVFSSPSIRGEDFFRLATIGAPSDNLTCAMSRSPSAKSSPLVDTRFLSIAETNLDQLRKLPEKMR